MKKFFILLAIVVYVFYSCNNFQKEQTKSSSQNTSKFVSLPTTTIDANSIVIVAAENCPREGTRRANRLAQELSKKGIPFSRTSTVGFSVSEPNSPLIKTTEEVMNGESPIVFVKGKAKANPTLEEVIAEYNKK